MKSNPYAMLTLLVMGLMGWMMPAALAAGTTGSAKPKDSDQNSSESLQNQPAFLGGGCCCRMGRGMGRGSGMQGGRGHGRGNGMGRGAQMGWRADDGGPRQDMQEVRPVIHDLLSQHAQIKRRVEVIPQGIRSETTSETPQVTEQIRKHVRQMQSRIKEGQPMRMWDPLFREIFRHADKIQIKVEEIPGGMRVTETSGDPQVQKLIRLHAEAIGGFIKSGFDAAMEPHEVPEDGPAGSGKKSSL